MSELLNKLGYLSLKRAQQDMQKAREHFLNCCPNLLRNYSFPSRSRGVQLPARKAMKMPTMCNDYICSLKISLDFQ